MKLRFIHLVLIQVFMSCSPTSLILNQTKIVSYYFDAKISKMDKDDVKDSLSKEEIVQTKILYAYGILMEKGDRLIDENYEEGLVYYEKANKLFVEAKELTISILLNQYPDFLKWTKNDLDINLDKKKVPYLYWLAASMAGSIKSSRGTNPHELVNIPVIGKLLETAISLDPKWGEGSLQSAMMSYSAIRPDLNKDALKDTVDFYFKKALEFSDSLDASIFVSYAELIHKPRQEKDHFENKLLFVLKMKPGSDKKRKLSNLVSKRRAKWLLSKKEDYFL